MLAGGGLLMSYELPFPGECDVSRVLCPILFTSILAPVVRGANQDGAYNAGMVIYFAQFL